MRRSFHFIANPLAGRGRQALVAEVMALVRAAGAEVRIGTASGEVAALAEARAVAETLSTEAVVAAGGDGTIRLAAKAVAGTGVALGVIPLGTGNVLANEVGLPRDAPGIADLLLHGEARPIRTATANGELFLLMAGVGFDGRVIGRLNHAMKNRLGKLAYVPPLLRALGTQGDQLTVDIDGEHHEASWVVVANARCYGGAFVMAPATSILTPGLEVVLFRGRHLGHRMAELARLGLGGIARSRAILTLPGRRIAIASPRPVPTQIDGDAFGPTPLAIRSDGPDVALILPHTGGTLG